MLKPPALIFDLDGTLIDSVYEHVSTWHRTLRKAGIETPQWKIHRSIGMSGKLFLPRLLRELRRPHSKVVVARLEDAHARAFRRSISGLAALPGASELLRLLRRCKIPFAVATSGGRNQTKLMLQRIGGYPNCPVITADDVAEAKPAPDIFALAAERLGREPNECFVVGDSVWDVLAARRMTAPAVALLSGGFDTCELQSAGAYRVYGDTEELGDNLEQLGIQVNK